MSRPSPITTSASPTPEHVYPHPALIQATASASPKTRILYVDDDACSRRFGELVLSHAGYAVDPVDDGETAWDALRSRAYDLLVTDNQMPRLNGLQLIARLRMAGMTFPIVVASSSIKNTPHHALEWLRVAATLPKPFSHHELLDTIERALHAPHLNDFNPEIEPLPHWGINE